MAETRARDLANLAGAGATSSTVAYHETARGFTLPAGTGDPNQVISSDGDGTTQWKTSVSAPLITSVSTPASDNSINVDDNVVMTVTGANFDSLMTAKLVDASNETSIVTGHSTSDLSVNFSSSNSVSVTTRAATASISQSNVKLVLTKSGLTATSASIGVSPDPTITSLSNPHATLLDNLGSGQNVGSAISASSSDGASITYSISGATSAGNTYIIGSTSGQITTPSAGIADVTSGTSYSESPTVTATAGGDSTRTATISVPLVINTYVPQLFSGAIYEANNSTKEINFPDTFQPDLLWFKSRDHSNDHAVYNSITGVNSALITNSNVSANTSATNLQDLVSFDSDGCTLGAHSQFGSVNATTGDPSKVVWGFKAGGAATTLTGSSGGSGADTFDTNKISAVSRTVNVDGGFSICKVDSLASAVGSRPIPHGLGTTPHLVIWKTITTNNNWNVFHKDATSNTGLNNKFLLLNTNGYETDIGGSNTAADSNYYYTPQANNWHVNQGGRSVLVLSFVSKTGVSSIGGFTIASGNTGYTLTGLGFQPRFVMIKKSQTNGDWHIFDSFRSSVDPAPDYLSANAAGTEITYSGVTCSFDTDGFELGSYYTAQKYIYIAFK